MEFMLLFIDRNDVPAGEPAGLAELSKLASELASRGTLRRAAPLGPASAGTRIRVRDGAALVTDGPFAESKEALAGFWLFEAASREEAIALARRAYETGEPRPHARHGTVEVHAVFARRTFRDTGEGAPFLLAFRVEAGLCDHGPKMREMFAHGEALAKDGILVETAPLAGDPPPARIQSRRGRTLVIDGPFAESKEGVGGYSLIRAPSRTAALEIAKRYPHARWGPVELREMMDWRPVDSGPRRTTNG